MRKSLVYCDCLTDEAAGPERRVISRTTGFQMLKLRFLGILVTCALPHTAAAQPWMDAYKAGDYARAARLLQPIIMKQQQGVDTDPADPGPARHLALVYARGSGVARDPILACALARLSDMVRQNVVVAQFRDAEEAFAYKAILDESEQFVRAHCEALTDR
jgi:hypothetical protein